MNEIIANIYLVINKDLIEEFKAKSYKISGTDEEKIEYLKTYAYSDFENAISFEAPEDKSGKRMKYKNFAKLAKRGLEQQFFEEIFKTLKMPENPLICVTPVVDGKIISK